MVNDGSTDGSYSEMLKIAEKDKNIVLVNLSRNFGEHKATLAGLAHCTGTVAVRKAADLQEPSEMILEMYDKYIEGNKVVLAVRADREEGLSQKMFSSIYCGMMRKFALANMPKGGFDTFMISRQVIDILVTIGEKNAPVTEQILWTGFDSAKVYYTRKKREIGKSGWTFSKKVKLAIDSLLSFSYFPVRCISGVGVISFLSAFIWVVVILVQKCVGYIDVPGYTTLTILLLVSVGFIMLSLGIIGEYVWRMFDEVRNKPAYIVDEIKKAQALGTEDED